MEQLKLSDAFSRSRVPSRVMCFQRSRRGRFVGTLAQTDMGFTGHLIVPTHAVLPQGAKAGNLGFLHADQRTAFAMLALQVAKQSWDGSLDFDATCLVDQEDGTKAEFESWVTDMVCNIRAGAMYSLSSEEDLRKAMATKIRADVIAERRRLLVAKNMEQNSGSEALQ